MTNTHDQKYKIQVLIDGNRLTFNECLILPEIDLMFLRFKDKFDTVYRYNKNLILFMEELK